MARVRSPNYPQFGLDEAIKRIGPVFEKERQHPMPKEVLAKHLGYGGVNGASLGAISAMLKYGLVDQEGESYRVTDRALAILHPHNDLGRPPQSWRRRLHPHCSRSWPSISRAARLVTKTYAPIWSVVALRKVH